MFTITAMDGLANRKRRGGDPFEIGVMGPAILHGALTVTSACLPASLLELLKRLQKGLLIGV